MSTDGKQEKRRDFTCGTCKAHYSVPSYIPPVRQCFHCGTKAPEGKQEMETKLPPQITMEIADRMLEDEMEEATLARGVQCLHCGIRVHPQYAVGECPRCRYNAWGR